MSITEWMNQGVCSVVFWVFDKQDRVRPGRAGVVVLVLLVVVGLVLWGLLRAVRG